MREPECYAIRTLSLLLINFDNYSKFLPTLLENLKLHAPYLNRKRFLFVSCWF